MTKREFVKEYRESIRQAGRVKGMEIEAEWSDDDGLWEIVKQDERLIKLARAKGIRV